MLKLPAMPALTCFCSLLITLLAGWFGVLAQAGPAILTPAAGEAVRGTVTVTGTTQIEGFSSAELSFTYENSQDATWFLISQQAEPVSGGVLGEWDTTTIADGTYRLRLRVTLNDGQIRDVETGGLRVRNYSPIETRVPTAVLARPAARATVTPSPAPAKLLPTPGMLATNPALLTEQDLQSSLLRGALLALVFFLILGIYFGIRALFRDS